MKRVLHFSILAIISGIIALACAQPEILTMEDFKLKYDSLVYDNDLNALCEKYIGGMTEIDDLREIQSKWEDVNEDGVRAFTKAKLDKNPESAEWQYLYGRVAESIDEKVAAGRKAIELKPDWQYGYRLITATYNNELFKGRGSDGDIAYLDKELATDAGAFDKMIELAPSETFAYQFKAGYCKHVKDYAGLLAVLEEASKLEGRWPSGGDYAEAYAGMGDYSKAIEYVNAEAAANYGDDDEQKADREQFVKHRYGYVLSGIGEYDKAVDYIKKQKGLDESDYYNLACYSSLAGKKTDALGYLNKAVKDGYEEFLHAEEDSDLTALHGDKKWDKALADMKANFEATKEKRKEELLAGKIEIAAPDWELEDINGKVVRLSDLKGSIVVLDFWATWCPPCRMAMPVLDDFVDNYKTEDIRVFSVRVWEKGRNKAQAFMDEHEYDMELIFGDGELAKAYEVQGIPTLCVIDKEGVIRFRESGFSQGLLDHLKWWTEDLK